jgi:hypothetical protein
MQSGKCLSLVLAISIIVACAPNQALTDTKTTYAPVSEEFDVKINDVRKVRVLIKWGDPRECKASVSYSNDPGLKEFVEVKPTDPKEIRIASSRLIRCGSIDGNQRCETCFFITEGSPRYMYYNIGGRIYWFCICDCPPYTPPCY